MKARILENNKCILYTQEFLDFKVDETSMWHLTDVLPSLDIIKPIWNGSEWIEGATAEEIAEQELEKQKFLKQQQYEELLETDWYVVRFVETGIPVPEEILQQRQEIRNKYK